MITFNFIDNKNIHSIIPFLQLLHNDISEEILKARLNEMIKENYKCIGIYDEKSMIGICGIWTLVKYYVGKHIELDNVIIVSQYQNKGIGSQLMGFIDNYSKEIGCVGNELNCYIHNEEGNRFWEKEGYQKIGYHYQKKFST